MRRTIQRDIEDQLSEKILYGELRPGQIVVVDVAPADAEVAPGDEAAIFTFVGEDKAEIADIPPIEEIVNPE